MYIYNSLKYLTIYKKIYLGSPREFFLALKHQILKLDHLKLTVRAFISGAASQEGDADSSREPDLTSSLQGSVKVHCGALLLVPQWQCISSLVFYIFSHLFPFPARGSTQVLLCLFPGVLWLWHFLYSVGPHPVSSLHKYTFVVSRAFMAGAASQAGDADSSGHLVSPLVCSGPWMSTVVLYCWCHSDSASVLLYFA